MLLGVKDGPCARQPVPDKGVTQQGPRELKGVVHSGPTESSCGGVLSGRETSAEPWSSDSTLCLTKGPGKWLRPPGLTCSKGKARSC